MMSLITSKNMVHQRRRTSQKQNTDSKSIGARAIGTSSPSQLSRACEVGGDGRLVLQFLPYSCSCDRKIAAIFSTRAIASLISLHFKKEVLRFQFFQAFTNQVIFSQCHIALFLQRLLTADVSKKFSKSFSTTAEELHRSNGVCVGGNEILSALYPLLPAAHDRVISTMSRVRLLLSRASLTLAIIFFISYFAGEGSHTTSKGTH